MYTMCALRDFNVCRLRSSFLLLEQATALHYGKMISYSMIAQPVLNSSQDNNFQHALRAFSERLNAAEENDYSNLYAWIQQHRSNIG